MVLASWDLTKIRSENPNIAITYSIDELETRENFAKAWLTKIFGDSTLDNGRPKKANAKEVKAIAKSETHMRDKKNQVKKTGLNIVKELRTGASMIGCTANIIVIGDEALTESNLIRIFRDDPRVLIVMCKKSHIKHWSEMVTACCEAPKANILVCIFDLRHIGIEAERMGAALEKAGKLFTSSKKTNKVLWLRWEHSKNRLPKYWETKLTQIGRSLPYGFYDKENLVRWFQDKAELDVKPRIARTKKSSHKVAGPSEAGIEIEMETC